MHQSASTPAEAPTSGGGPPYLVQIDGLGPRGFLLDQRPQRMSGALGISIVTHVAFAALLLWLIRLSPIGAPPEAPDLSEIGLVFLNVEGPGGGGGGGGNKAPEPPRKLEAPGKDKLTVAVNKPPEPKPIPPKEPDVQPEPVTIPVVEVQSGALNLPGEVLTPRPIAPTESLGSGTGSGAGTGRGSGSGSGSGSGLGSGEGGGFGGGAYRLGAGLNPPRLVFDVKPKYTNDAMRAKIIGKVLLDVVVQADGAVGEVRVARSLDATFGLDQEALRVVRLWKFAPATQKATGQPVPVLVQVEVVFNIW